MLGTKIWACADTLWHSACAVSEPVASVLLYRFQDDDSLTLVCAAHHGGVHPMMRHLADAAPQRGEQAFRSGQQVMHHAASAGLQHSGYQTHKL